jgi:hypothetical protein
MTEDNGWAEYRQRVFFQLDTLTKQMEALQNQYQLLHVDVVVLKAKAAIYGALAGAIFAVALQLFFHFVDLKAK